MCYGKKCEKMKVYLTYSIWSNGRFREQPLSFLKFSVPFVCLTISALVWGQVTIPASDYVSVQLGVFKVTSFKSINLSLQVCQGFLKYCIYWIKIFCVKPNLALLKISLPKHITYLDKMKSRKWWHCTKLWPSR